MRRRIRSRFVLLLPALAAFVLLAAACEDDNDVDPIDDTETPTAVTTPTPDPVDDTDVDDTDPAEPAEPTEVRADVEEIDGSGVTGEVIIRSADDANGTGLDDANGLDDDANGLGDDTGLDDDANGLNDDANGLDDDANGLGAQTGQTEVEVNLSGLDEEADYSHAIFRGSCQDVENGLDDANGFADDNGLDDGNGLDDDNGLNGMNDDEHMLDPFTVDEDGNVDFTSTIDADFQELSTGHYYAVFEGMDAQTGTAVACADLEEDDDNGLFDDGEDDDLMDDDNEDDDTF